MHSKVFLFCICNQGVIKIEERGPNAIILSNKDFLLTAHATSFAKVIYKVFLEDVALLLSHRTVTIICLFN